MTRPLLGVSCCLRPGGPEPVHGVIDRYLRAPAAHADCDVVLVPALPLRPAREEVTQRAAQEVVQGHCAPPPLLLHTFLPFRVAFFI